MPNPWEEEYDKPPQRSQLPENIVRSAGQFGGQIWDAVKGMVTDEKGSLISPSHPLGATPTGVANLALGVANKFGPGHVGPEPMTEYPEAVGAFYGNRYGSVDKALNTAYEDPVGTAADVSMLLGGGSLAARGGTRLAEMANLPRVARVAGQTGEALNTLSAITDPIRIGFNAATLPLRTDKIPVINRFTPEALYQSAMKPRPSLSDVPGKVERIVQTGLKEGIPVSGGGVKQAWGLIDDLSQQVKGYIDDATARGVTIDPLQIRKRIDDVRAKYQGQFISAGDLEKIDKLEQKFLSEYATPSTSQPTASMTAAEAQEAKQKAYQKLKGKYGKKSSDAKLDTLKALARGANEELRAAIPEITAPNVRESALLDFTPELQRSVSRTGNYQLLGLGAPSAGGLMFAATGSKEAATAAAILTAIFDHPMAKSKLAIAIYNGMKANPEKYGAARMTTATARANAYIDQLRKQTETAPTPAP